MRNLAYFGFWTCAALYAAVGLIGVVLLGAQPNIADSGDGYAVRTVAQQ